MDTGLYSSTGSTDAQQKLASFWNTVNEEINTVQDFKTQELPLARIKKIMKMDEEVKMISAEAPVLFAKAAEIFINELSLRAWIHTEDNKRRTLQRNDIAMAVAKYDQFDFLIDIVPRDELKPQKRQETVQETEIRTPNADQVQYYFQLANPATSSANSTTNIQTASSTQPQQITNQQPTQNSQPIVIGNQASLNLSSNNTLQIQPTQVMQTVGLQQNAGIQVTQNNTLTQNAARPNTSTAESSNSQQQQQQLYNMTTLRFNSQLPTYNRPSLNSNQYSYSEQLSYLQPQVYNSNQTTYQGNQQNRSNNQD
ncbi:nuclear transcription factor Y subunit gamma-like [Bolinopsis microptera]|uniref:nuclear transcription factor Y subunit gamma-like n=1 Tax=Bolinopsis microptera TaxID=2820187 RepID=UPI003079DCB6